MSMPEIDGAQPDAASIGTRRAAWRLIADIPQRFRREVSSGA